ncbi:MAG: hypothetical protein ACHQCF_03070 [Solirubrobacterales bacterium]
MIPIIFVESETGAEACCGETTGPNTFNNGASDPEAAARSEPLWPRQCIRPDTVPDSDYNHHSVGRRVKGNFGLPQLANTAPEVGSLGAEDLSRPDGDQSAKPKNAAAGRRTTFQFELLTDLPFCRRARGSASSVTR